MMDIQTKRKCNNHTGCCGQSPILRTQMTVKQNEVHTMSEETQTPHKAAAQNEARIQEPWQQLSGNVHSSQLPTVFTCNQPTTVQVNIHSDPRPNLQIRLHLLPTHHSSSLKNVREQEHPQCTHRIHHSQSKLPASCMGNLQLKVPSLNDSNLPQLNMQLLFTCTPYANTPSLADQQPIVVKFIRNAQLQSPWIVVWCKFQLPIQFLLITQQLIADVACLGIAVGH